MPQIPEPPFFGLRLSVFNSFVSTKIYDNRHNFDNDRVNCPLLDGDDPRRPS